MKIATFLLAIDDVKQRIKNVFNKYEISVDNDFTTYPDKIDELYETIPEKEYYLRIKTESAPRMSIKLNHFGDNKPDCQYSIDFENWYDECPIANKNQWIYLRGNNPTGFNHSEQQYSKFIFYNGLTDRTTVPVTIEGHLSTLLNYNKRLNTPYGNFCFYQLFCGSTAEYARKLILPTENLPSSCFEGLFSLCSLLKSIPDIIIKSVIYNSNGSYKHAFSRCQSLTDVSDIKWKIYSTSTSSLSFILSNCVNLVKIPEIKIYTLGGTYFFQESFELTKIDKVVLKFILDKINSTSRGAWYYGDYILYNTYGSTKYFYFNNNTVDFRGYIHYMFRWCGFTSNTNLYVRKDAGSGRIWDSTPPAQQHYLDVTEIEKIDPVYVKHGDTVVPTNDLSLNTMYNKITVVAANHDYLFFDVISGGTVSYQVLDNTKPYPTVYYSYDTTTWNNLTGNLITNTGDKIFLRGISNDFLTELNIKFSITGQVNLYGNPLTLVGKMNTDNSLPYTLPFTLGGNWSDGYANNICLPFKANNLFEGCDVYDVKNLRLTPTHLTIPDCYKGMFKSCKKLINTPLLPAVELSDNCYEEMFDGCTNLTGTMSGNIPVDGPTLIAPTLVSGCYKNMFNGCGNLNYIKCLATDITANNCTENWVNNVKNNGIFVKHIDETTWENKTSGDGIPVGNWEIKNAYA